MKKTRITALVLSAVMCASVIMPNVDVMADESVAEETEEKTENKDDFDNDSDDTDESSDSNTMISEETDDWKNEADISETTITQTYKPMNNQLVVDSGFCGKNITWTLDYDGVLTIAGSGNMYNWNGGLNPPPWKGKDVRSIDFSGEINHIGQDAFWDCDNLISITIPGTVDTIGVRDSALKPTMKEAYSTIKEQNKIVKDYLISKGIQANEIDFKSVSANPDYAGRYEYQLKQFK